MSKKLRHLAPSEFHAALDRLFGEIAVLHGLWEHHNFLFASGNQRVEMLNICASWFFGMTQRMMTREMILGISRLTDSATIGPFDNLTIAGLLRDPALRGQRNARRRLRRRVARAIRLAEPIRTHRNKYVAHLDHALAVGNPATPLPRFPLATVGKTIHALEDAYNEHARTVRNAHASFGSNALGGAEALCGILEDSERWKQWLKAEAENPSY